MVRIYSGAGVRLMSNLKKLMQRAAAGAAGGAGLDVNEVFSTYLYDGTNATQTITNGIDLSGEGGLVWIKNRDYSPSNHLLFDTERGAAKVLYSNATDAEASTTTYALQSFTSTGFTLGPNGYQGNRASTSHASWTFRKAPKFFDVVTYTGAAFVDQTVSHNLGSVPGMIIIKCTSSARNWVVYHRSLGNTKHLHLNTTDAESTVNYFNNTDPTDTTFTVEGGDSDVNGYNETYVAYLFAHNDGDGTFGPTGDQDIIKCGSVTLDGSGQGLVDLGFEPEWVMYKRTDGAGNWIITDSMRGWTALPNQAGAMLLANSNLAEGAYSPASYLNSSGFLISGSASQNYIYIAIRRGPMGIPESATDVFAIDTAGGTSPTPPTFVSGFPVDFSFYKNKTDSVNNWGSQNRLTGYGDLAFNATSAEYSNSGTYWQKDYMNGIGSNTGTNSNGYQWMWRRAPSYFDAVAYTGNGTNNHVINHNLGVAPEIILIKRRDAVNSWNFATQFTGSGYISGYLQQSGQFYSRTYGTSDVHYVQPTDTQFTVNNYSIVNASSGTYIAYLFASLAGISKVGSFTGNGSTQDIDCGFSSGARFVLIKKTNSVSNWFLWDSERGIVAGDDPVLQLNITSAEVTGYDWLDPLSSGFTLNAVNPINQSGDTYIFYAIA